MSRQYRHDCEECRFLGLHSEGDDSKIYDLYHCLASQRMMLKREERHAFPGTIIARHGNEPGDFISLSVTNLLQHENELRARLDCGPLLEGLARYRQTHHEIEDVNVRGWRCQLYRSPLGFITIRTIDDDIELFVDCVPETGPLDAKAMQAGVQKAVIMMREQIEQELLRRRRRWRKR